MKIKFHGMKVFSLWILVLIPLSLISRQDIPSFLAFFKSQSIPVEDIRLQSDSVTLTLHYKEVADSADDDMESHVLTIVRKVAEEWEGSKNVIINVYDSGEPISELRLDALDAFAYAQGNMGDEETLSRMAVKEYVSIEDLLASLIPKETDLEKPVKIINPPASDFAEMEAKPNYANDRDADTKRAKVENKSIFAENQRELSQLDKKKSDPNTHEAGLDDGLTAYVGAVFTRHDGEGIKLLGVLEDSPAANTGLQEGDIILEVGNISVRDKGARPEVLTEMVQKLPADKPLRFYIEREGRRFDVWIKPLRIDEEQLAAYQKEGQAKFSSDYARGRELMAEENYSGAIECFQRSLESKAQIMESYQGLGICYYHLGKYKEARKSIENTLKLDKNQPLSWFYGALNMDALDRRNGAMDAYKRYLKLNHDNAEMNAFAQTRLEELRKNRRSDWGSQLLKIIDAIKKEIKK
jgi:tetratricopeptide (TPR) repeat protein